MSTVAHSHPYIVGVDTHAPNHVYSIVTAHTGTPLGSRSFPTSAAGITRAISSVTRHTEADAETLWVIEGAASYGAILAGIVAAHGYPVAEALVCVPKIDAESVDPMPWTLFALPQRRDRCWSSSCIALDCVRASVRVFRSL